jgi:AbiV family abortive infection protein
MRPKALRDIMSMPVAARNDAIEAGILTLAEHIEVLRQDLDGMARSGSARSAAIVTCVAQEEAAKILILLDIVRMGWRNQAGVREQMRRFYDHFARGIYAEVIGTRPADFDEVRELVNSLRASHYVDGPNSFEWIFRNDVMATREESLYVDYVATDEGPRWVSPQWRAEISLPVPPTVIALALALTHSGFGSIKGQELIRSAWRSVEISGSTHWLEVEQINRRLLQSVIDAGLTQHLTQDEARHIIYSWTFPLHTLDLRMKQVAINDLREMQSRRSDALERDFWGCDGASLA